VSAFAVLHTALATATFKKVRRSVFLTNRFSWHQNSSRAGEKQASKLRRSTQKITEFVSGRKVVWHVTKSRINFVQDKSEWDGTDVVFEINRKGGMTELRFTHRCLVPAIECYGGCSGAWAYFINESLRDLITTGKGKPETKEEEVLEPSTR
jgi:hypothetical protein